MTTETMVAPRKGRTLPNRIPTAAVAQSIVDFIRANADKNTKTITVSMSDIAKAIGLDFSRVLRAKDQLVAAGVLEVVNTSGKTYTYRLKNVQVPTDLVFRHKTYPNAQPREQLMTIPQGVGASGLNKRDMRILQAALNKQKAASDHLQETLGKLGLVTVEA